MTITADTNVLIRTLVRDEPLQAKAADKALYEASLIAVTLTSLCELVWVLRTVYRFSSTDVASAIQALLNTSNVVLNRQAVEAGITCLRAGGDFADGVIAYEGKWLGGETFVSFDRKAVSLLREQRYSTLLLT